MPSCSVHEAYAWMEEVTSSNSCAFGASCRREFEKDCFVSSGTIPSQLCMCECILWFGRLITSTPYVFPSTPSHWLICLKKRSFWVLTLKEPKVHAQDFALHNDGSNQNSVVFRCKTTMWSCLSATTCSHVCSRTSSCFGACYLSSFLENLAMPSRRLVLQTFFCRHDVWNILLPTRSES